jgi:hypothetical protein
MMIQKASASSPALLLTWLCVLLSFHPSCGWVVLVRDRHCHATAAGTTQPSSSGANHQTRPTTFRNESKTLRIMSLHAARDRDDDEEESGERECKNDARNDDGEGDDIDDDNDEATNTAYGRKSLAWTNKFRTLFPYETARRSVMDLGLRNKDEWDEYVADGKPYHGPYLPNYPDQMYAAEWESWDEFLGIIRSYDETRQIVQQVLRLRNMDEYNSFVESDRPRAEGLRIPAQPRLCYQYHGTWRSDAHFFGPEEDD